MAYDNTNRGTIAKNTRKTQDTHPDIAGSINVDGVDYWINGWLKKNGKDGSTFYSLTVKPKEERKAEAPKPRQQSMYDRDDKRTHAAKDEPFYDDDLPF